MKHIVSILFAILMAAPVWAQGQFAAVEVVIDPKGEPLAAYQLEISAPRGVKFVGIEGGEHPEFRKAPFYDAKAMRRERLVVAAFSTASDEKLPTRAIRVLTLHLEYAGDEIPKLETILKVAADARGQAVTAEVKLRNP